MEGWSRGQIYRTASGGNTGSEISVPGDISRDRFTERMCQKGTKIQINIGVKGQIYRVWEERCVLVWSGFVKLTRLTNVVFLIPFFG